MAVQVLDDGGSTQSSSTAVTVGEAPLGPVVVRTPDGIPEGQTTGSFTVATFTDTNVSAVASDFTAVISWGDGSTQSVSGATGGIVSTGNGTFAVIGNHVFAEEMATTTLAVAVTDGTNSTSSHQTFTVTDVPLVIKSFTPPSPKEFRAFSGTVATFTDADPAGVLSDYTAFVAWGDGTTVWETAANGGIVRNPDGSFSVLATAGPNTYKRDNGNSLLFSVTIRDTGGSGTAALQKLSVGDLPLQQQAQGAPSSVQKVNDQVLTELALAGSLGLDGPSVGVIGTNLLGYVLAQQSLPQAQSLFQNELAMAYLAPFVVMDKMTGKTNTTQMLNYEDARGLILTNPLYATPAGFAGGLCEGEALVAIVLSATGL
jgi:hypothetical protein